MCNFRSTSKSQAWNPPLFRGKPLWKDPACWFPSLPARRTKRDSAGDCSGPATPSPTPPATATKTAATSPTYAAFRKWPRPKWRNSASPPASKWPRPLIESQAGTSRLATKNNNHFGIKCFSKSCKKGHCANFSDDHHKDFFRTYVSAWESWRSHSYLIVKGKYKKLLENGTDYKDWARGLKELGYATDPRYTEKLLEYIERYDLQTLDR
ncbi:MAG: glucosaminidase domain-containing protein [Saprospirales bacterium]|nr:glucosaminidase domain-containing protein [Saprospirales bacterium]